MRDILSKEEGGCNFSDKSTRPHMMVESVCGDKTMFFITVPGAAVTGILEVLRQNGVGEFVGRVLLSPVEYVKPGLDMPLFVEARKRKGPAKKLQVCLSSIICYHKSKSIEQNLTYLCLAH